MNKRIILAAILCSILQAQNSKDKCTLEGTVLNSVTGEGVKKAQVVVRAIDRENGQNLVTTANSAGHFSVENLEPGRYSVIASRNGFVHPAFGPHEQGSIQTVVQAGESHRDVELRLIPQGIITGRVLDEDGDPINSVSVQAFVSQYQQGRKQLAGVSAAVTNDLGEFRIPGLSPGHYLVLATPAQVFPYLNAAPAGGPQAGVAFAPVYYPNALQPSSAIPLKVTAGAQLRGIDVTVSKTRAVRVVGRVVDALNKMLVNAGVTLAPRNPTPGTPQTLLNAIQVSDGTFQFHGVQPGPYVLATDYIEGNVHLSGRVLLEVGTKDIDDAVITAGPPPEIHGRIVADGNGDVQLPNIYIQLESRTGGNQGGGSSAQPSGPEGSFVLKNIAPEQYDIRVEIWSGNAYVKSIKLGGEDVIDTGLDFTQGISSLPLTVNLRSGGGKVDGIVRDNNGKPSVDAMVVLIPDSDKRSSGRLYQIRFTDAVGHYSLSGIPPGNYKLFAWDRIDGEAYRDPDFLKLYESKGAPVSISESTHETKALTLISSAF